MLFRIDKTSDPFIRDRTTVISIILILNVVVKRLLSHFKSFASEFNGIDMHLNLIKASYEPNYALKYRSFLNYGTNGTSG